MYEMISEKRIKELLNYCPNTGLFTWNVNFNKLRKSGYLAGHLMKSGYIQIGLDGKRYYAHRLAWIYCNGEWPINFIDHINMDRSDNRIENLREASVSENMRNRRKTISNTSGYKGVTWSRKQGKWQAQIGMDYKNIKIGFFEDPKEAHEAYCNAASKIHEKFARGE